MLQGVPGRVLYVLLPLATEFSKFDNFMYIFSEIYVINSINIKKRIYAKIY